MYRWAVASTRPPRTRLLRVARGLALAGAALVASGCGHPRPPVLPGAAASPTVLTTVAADAWGRLAGLAATGQDHRYLARYTLTTPAPGTTSRVVTVTAAQDGSWSVELPGGALSGTVDNSITQTNTGRYECRLDGVPQCVQIGVDGSLPPADDPQWEHVFTDWLTVLSDRHAALFVASAAVPPGGSGQCFSIEPDATALAAPVPAGRYCFASDGTVTAVVLAGGALRLIGAPAPAPRTARLPGPVVTGSALPVIAQPSPPPSVPASAARTR